MLKQQIQDQVVKSLKAGDKVRLETMRYALSEIKNFEIDNGEQDDAGVRKLLAKQVKQMREAIEQFDQGGRQDLVDQETAQMKILQEFLPAQIDQVELEKIIERTIIEKGAQLGAVIGAVMQQVRGRADGKLVADLVKQKLN